jgi:hypothetical protein
MKRGASPSPDTSRKRAKGEEIWDVFSVLPDEAMFVFFTWVPAREIGWYMFLLISSFQPTLLECANDGLFLLEIKICGVPW